MAKHSNILVSYINQMQQVQKHRPCYVFITVFYINGPIGAIKENSLGFMMVWRIGFYAGFRYYCDSVECIYDVQIRSSFSGSCYFWGIENLQITPPNQGVVAAE